MAVRLIRGLEELVPRYDGFIVDLWGVIHDGVAPFPGALECLRSLKEAGKQIVLLSNAPRRAEDVIRRIAAIGVPRAAYDDVMSSGEEAWQHLSKLGRGRDGDSEDPFYDALGRACLHIGSDRDMEIREGLDLDFVESPAAADFILNTGPAGWEDTIEDYDPILRHAVGRDLPMVCANPDLVVMHGGRPALCAGALAQHYETIGGRVRWHGKPHRSVYDSCLDRLEVASTSRILTVGDSLRTDIAGAAAAGLDSLLIAGGIHAAEFGGGINQALDLECVSTALDRAGLKPIGVARRFRW
ncbi:MAG: TIGR01459 family HAD-type hydrolase [Alphaproteobacteria bacterium]|nr:TIGR01459 family HAD-type hydrolase [Alphaproteobacteria bacterium]